MYNFNEEDTFAVYLRKSQADDPNEPIEVTLAKHKERLLETMKKHNINEKQVTYFEEVVSGDTIAERPKIQELLRLVNNGQFRGVFVVALDRFSRGDSIDQGIINNSFYFSNTLIITCDKIYDIANNEIDREQLEFSLFMSKREYNLIKKRMHQGSIDNAKRGYYVHSKTPYGYSKVRDENKRGYILVPNEEAEIVKIMFEKACDGMGTTNIAKYLDKINAKPRVNSYWTPAMVRNILINPIYYGVIVVNKKKTQKTMQDGKIIKKVKRQKEYEMYEGKHIPLISEEVYKYTQTMLKSKSTKKVSHSTLKNPLAGLIKCGKCQELGISKLMVRRPYPNVSKDTLLCNRIGCSNVSSYISLVEKALIKSLEDILNDYKNTLNNYEEIKKKEALSQTKTLNYIAKETSKLNKQLEKIKEYYELEDYTREEYLERRDTIKEKITNLNNEKEKIINNKDNELLFIKKIIPKLENCLKEYPLLENAEEKNELLKSILKCVTYTKEKGGRWDNEQLTNFKLDIELKV